MLLTAFPRSGNENQMRNILPYLQVPHASCLAALVSSGEALQQIRSAFTSRCQSLLPVGEMLSPSHGAGGEKSKEKLHGNIPWGLKGNFPVCMCCKPCS